ncbi:RmlC-like cupin [Echria macrotheca]|uniref:RmlC-like cupin n=1 Tax=Echria macrotheca TaxID=438768 RepID=A0AAJ0F1A8_9PEZI|nr:RmlC-like cupin [Echria macrotheca]
MPATHHAPTTRPETRIMPRKLISCVRSNGGEILRLGFLTCRIIEDGTNTGGRVGAIEFTLPPKSAGLPPHWHEKHDETFVVLSGQVRFHDVEGHKIDAGPGDHVTVPLRAPYKYENVGEIDARFVGTFCPALYVNSFRLMETMAGEGMRPNRETMMEAMSHFGAFPAECMES